MGMKLDVLLERKRKNPKIEILSKLAISRVAILKNQHLVRLSHAWSDVAQLLNFGCRDRALLRVEVVLREQNMVDAFCILECYCHILADRGMLMQKQMECPEEIKEAVSSLIFAASRYRKFPELHEIRYLITKIFGTEFAAHAVELQKDCGVNPRIIEKFSTRRPSMESRLKALKEIAYENGILSLLDIADEEILDMNHGQEQLEDASDSGLGDDAHIRENIDNKNFASMNSRNKDDDVIEAAEDAFELAAYEAAAARLSTSGSGDNVSDAHGSFIHQLGNKYHCHSSNELPPSVQTEIHGPKSIRPNVNKTPPICYLVSDSDDEAAAEPGTCLRKEKSNGKRNRRGQEAATHWEMTAVSGPWSHEKSSDYSE